MAAMASDQSGEKPSSIGAVANRQTSNPRNRLVISPGGKAPAWRGDHRRAEVDAFRLGPADRGQQPGRRRRDAPSARPRSGCAVTAPSPKPSTPARSATAQTAARMAGTVTAASLIWASEKGRQRARPPVRVSTRSPPSSGIVAPNRASAAEDRGQGAHPQGVGRRTGPRASRPARAAAAGTGAAAATPARSAPRRPTPLPRLGVTWPTSMARRSTTMSRARPMSRAKNAPEMPLTSAPPLTSRVRRMLAAAADARARAR